MKQATLRYPEWGGVRRGAGRKRSGPRALVPHDARERLAPRFPVHVTMRLRAGLPNLRRERTHARLLAAMAAGADRFGFKLVHYSAMTNHLHLICEARDERSLSRGMQGLGVRLAKAMNRAWQRAGSVFGDRYHAHILKTPREVKHALAYVLHNAHHHRIELEAALDPFSSAKWFDGWRVKSHELMGPASRSPLGRATTWLLDVGWRRRGLLELTAGAHSN